jgi:hypothetical protein
MHSTSGRAVKKGKLHRDGPDEAGGDRVLAQKKLRAAF